jgi:membrane protein insertase Oxa1/YidC/SpoIIIJ
MVLSIRKISYENDDLAGAGIWWFKNLNEADPYMILPVIATVLNYINLGVRLLIYHFNQSTIERNH